MIALLGLAAIACGVVFNEITYTFFLTRGVWSSYQTIAVVWVVDLALVLSGVAIVRWSRVGWALDAAMMVVVTVLLLVLVEAAFGGLRMLKRPPAVWEGGDFVGTGHAWDAQLGDKPKPSMRGEHVRKVDGSTVYDVHYTIDAESRRVTPQTNPSDRTEFLAFFGCSYTFGLGVEDDETMPFYAAAAAPRHHVYNYGFAGYGTHQMLAQLQRDGIRAEIGEPSGIAVYTFIDHHIRRASGMSDAVWGNLWDGPYFTLDGTGRLVHSGGFRWGRPLVSFASYAASRSQTVRYLERGFPPMRDAYVDLTARMIIEARDTFVAKFGSDAFYVVFHPGAQDSAKLIPRLEAAGVKYLDYSRLFEGRDRAVLVIHDDGHPTGTAHRIVAERLVTDLGIGTK